MKKSVSRLVSVLCVIALIICHFVGCGNNTEDTETPKLPAASDTSNVPVHDKKEEPDNSWLNDISTKSRDPDAAVETDYTGGDNVTVGAENVMLQNPLFITNESGDSIVDLMMVPLLETDRAGYVVQNGVEGEVGIYNDTEYTYNGIASVKIDGNTLHFTLNEDVYFSDGVNLTADDVIFTMYVLADPAYDGTNTFASLPIVGLDEYHGKMQQKWRAILNVLASGEASDDYTSEEYEAFSAAFEEAGLIFTNDIIRGCVENFADDYVYDVMGITYEELLENEGLQIAFSQYFWDYSTGYGEDGLWYDISGKSYDLTETFPTVEEYWQLIFKVHGYDISDSGINYEKIGERNFADILISIINSKYPHLTLASEDLWSSDNISGIEKTGMYSFSVTMTELTPEHLRGFCFYVAPLHHYGSREEYKYTENKFGFEKGDLSEIKAKTNEPLGAGAYKYDSTDENGNIHLKRNTLYYKGCPNITNLIVSESVKDTDLYYKSYGGIGSYTENYIRAETNAYVIIGMNAERISVEGDKTSKKSVSLRNAFATVFRAYRETAVLQWENSEVQSATDGGVWAANFEEITGTVRVEAIRLLKAAGYKWDNDAERFTEAPEGASLTYEVKLFNNDAAYIVLTHAKDLFADLGITLEITVQSTKESLKNIINAGEAEMWVMQINNFSTEYIYDAFHSEGENGIFSVSSEKLDKRIERADREFDKEDSAEEYKEILEEVFELGVIVPIYKQVDAVFFSERIIEESIADDMTAYWSWVREVHLLETNEVLTPVS